MSLKLYLFEPLSPLHLGGGRIGDPTEAQALARSDTIAAAILSLWGHIANVGDEEITQLSEKPPFAVSSTIPAIQRNRRWEPPLPVPTHYVSCSRAECPMDTRHAARFCCQKTSV